ncbi:MAG TPA: phage tail terminator-like protein [Sedimentisphaerales bacterium]|nr:phage tail terminator-like protein [Sedimentisphaerales bacterium]HUU15569.1 phage tail terminator-like protein [Sedimentisphaerales bacterium]
MTKTAIANAIRSRFKAQVADALSLGTQYDNQKYDNPDNAKWCRLTVKFGETLQKSVGSPTGNRGRTPGVMIAQLFGPVGKGDGALLEVADAVETAFKRVTDTGVTFRTPSTYPRGRSGDEWQINVECPFYADDIG